MVHPSWLCRSPGPGFIGIQLKFNLNFAAAKLARANWDYATAGYRQVVLTAFQQVEDGMSRLHHLGDENAAQQRSAAMSHQAATLSYNRYVKGAASILDVVTAQTAELAARQKLYGVETQRLQAAVGLIRATGGGWSAA